MLLDFAAEARMRASRLINLSERVARRALDLPAGLERDFLLAEARNFTSRAAKLNAGAGRCEGV